MQPARHVSLKPRDVQLPRAIAYTYLLLDARRRCLAAGVRHADDDVDAVQTIRRDDPDIDRAAFIYLSLDAGLWAGYAIVPLAYGGTHSLDHDRYLTTAQLQDAECVAVRRWGPRIAGWNVESANGTQFAEGEDITT